MVDIDFSEKIRKLMEKRGWSDYRLSKASNISPSTLSNIIRGKNMPTIPTLEEICKAFGITLSQFFADETEPVALSDEQKLMLDRWNALTPKQKEVTTLIMDSINNK